MGTQKAYGSPKWPGVNPAVGAAASSGQPTNQKITAAVGAFAAAYKNHLTSGTVTPGSRGTGGGIAPATGRRSSRGGGGGSGAKRSRAANAGAKLGHFLSTARQSGLREALRQFDLSDLRDKSLDEFLDAVVDRLSGDGGLIDDETLNRAMSLTIDELAENIESVDEFETLLESGDVDVEEMLQILYSNILSLNFEQKEYGVVREKISRENTSDFFERARGIIRAIVRDELSRERDLSSLNWNSPDGKRMADEINHEVLDILIHNE
ncbi:MAG: hypothetical protein ABSE05_13230 [Syntrophales bacterium]|jgi:hypothetical protein